MTENNDTQKLFSAIQSDDVLAFSDIVSRDTKCLQMRFGRFPVLSLCYLFNSKKIIKIYGQKLSGKSNDIIVDEPIEAYIKFKNIAGTRLRHYPEECSVPPETMLEMMPAQKMSPRNKRIITVAALAVVLVLIITSILTPIIVSAAGTGSESNPYKINTVSQLSLAKKDKHYILKNDLVLPSRFIISDFQGTLDGAGHRLTVSTQGTMVISNNHSFFINKNTGTIKNIKFNINAQLSEDKTSGELLVGLVVYENKGSIIDCIVDATITSAGCSNHNFAMAGFVALNGGMINNCKISEGSSFITLHTDVAGIAVYNSGIIMNCENNATIKQTSESLFWNPCSNGIAIYNGLTITGDLTEALILKCINYGDINVNVTAVNTSEEYVLLSTASGIVNDNYPNGTIEKCKNYGKIIVEGRGRLQLSAAGITVKNYGELLNNGSIGDIKGTIDDNGYLVCGGIVGYAWGGIIVDNFSLADIIFDTTLVATYIGGISGLTYCVWGGLWYTNSQINNNYYLKSDNVISGNGVFQTELNSLLTGTDLGTTALETVEEIKALVIYH